MDAATSGIPVAHPEGPPVPPPTADLAPSVRNALRRLEAGQASERFWSFPDSALARGAAPLFQYPAMMVSPMQGALLDAWLAAGQTGLVYDPFVGSGTTMVEAMGRGLPFAGQDLNPLAIMMCRVETGEAARLEPAERLGEMLERAARIEATPPEEHWAVKWFKADVLRDLAALAAAIRAEPDLRVRRLAWVTLAEVVRTSGQFRISTPKLQTRPPEQLARPIDVRSRFAEVAHRNIGRIAELRPPGPGRGPALACQDVRDGAPVADGEVRLVLTSPPYGDNHTTMPYGQASWLPLRWIDPRDLEPGSPTSALDAMKGLDGISLGGSLRVNEIALARAARRSPSLRELLGRLPQNSWAQRRVASFWSDMDVALEQVMGRCGPGALLAITLGDRTVGGLPVPTTEICREMLRSHRAADVDLLVRRIPRGRRIAARNASSSTIGGEKVLLMQAP